MRRRHKPGALAKYKSFTEYDLELDENIKQKVAEFKGDNELFVELGAGKCAFAIELAAINPQAKVIAVEFKEELLHSACEVVQKKELNNIKFIHGFIEKIEDWFEPKTVDRLYINFCDPWPKARHYKRRLTYEGFLKLYKTILKDGAVVEFKTDMAPLYEFSLEQFGLCGMNIVFHTDNLIQDEHPDNIMTNYEVKFRRFGKKIHKITAVV